MFDGRDPALPCPLWDHAISSSFIWRCFDLQETGDHCCPDSPLRITCDGSAHRLCTNLSPWHCKLVLDTIQAHWLRSLSHSSRKLSNSQIVMFLCPLSCCHIFSLSSIIFPNFPCFLIFLKGFFSPHLGLTPQTFQWEIYIYIFSKEVGKQSPELRVTFIPVTLHHITVHHEGWYETLHHVTRNHIEEGNEGWCETLHHVTVHHITIHQRRVVWDFTSHNSASHNNTSHKRRERRVVTQGTEAEGWWRRMTTKGGDEGWSLRKVVTRGSGDLGKWWLREVVTQGSGD